MVHQGKIGGEDITLTYMSRVVLESEDFTVEMAGFLAILDGYNEIVVDVKRHANHDAVQDGGADGDDESMIVRRDADDAGDDDESMVVRRDADDDWPPRRLKVLIDGCWCTYWRGQ